MATNPYMDLLSSTTNPNPYMELLNKPTPSTNNPYMALLKPTTSSAPSSIPYTPLLQPGQSAFKPAAPLTFGQPAASPPANNPYLDLLTKTSPTQMPSSTISYLPSQLGSGAYNQGTPGQLIDTGHTTYGGLPQKVGNQRDDIVPVSLGGSNQTPHNLQYLPADQAAYKDKVEKYALGQYKMGKMTLQAAQNFVENWKNNDIPGQVAYDKQFGGPQNDISNFLKGLPAAAMKVGTSIAQAIPRAAVSTGLTLGSALPRPASMPPASTTFTPEKYGPVATAIFGKEPVTSLQTQGKQLSQSYPNVPPPIVALGVAAGDVLNLLPFGGEQGMVKALTATKDATEAARILRTAGVAEDLIPQAAQKFAALTSEGDVKAGLNSIAELQNATKTVFTNPSIGNIEPLLGSSNTFGLAKIEAKHPEVLPYLADAIKNAQPVEQLPNMTILESNTPQGVMRIVVDHQLGTEGGIVPKTFVNNAYFKTDVLRAGIEPATQGSSNLRSTTELSERTPSIFQGTQDVKRGGVLNTPSGIGTGQVPGEESPSLPTGETTPPRPNTLFQTNSAPSTALKGDLNVSSPETNAVNLKVNPEHLNITPEAKSLLNGLGDELAPKTAAKVGDTMSNQEVINFAKANPNLTLNQVSRDASLKANAAMLQARQTLAAQMDALQKGTVSVSDKAEIIKNFLEVKTTATDLGRSLQKMSVSANPSEGSTVADIISKIAKTGANVDDIIAAAKNVDFNNYNQVVTFYRQFVKPTAGDWIDLVRYNSMLSSPLTLSNISSGNLFNIATQPVVKSTAGAIDWLKTGVFGGTQTHFVGEGPAYVKGAAQNIGNAFSKMTDVLKGNLDPKMLDFNVPIASQGAKGMFVRSMSIFSTLHNAMYQFFNTIAKGGSDASMAYKGATGPLADLAAQAEADYTTFRAGTMPEGQGGLLNAVDSVASAFKQWSASDNPFLSWPTKFTLPFLRISTNMAKQMIEYSPAGLTTAIGAGDPITQVAKASLGTAAFAAIGTMAAAGNITGAEPTVAADKNAFLASGRQPYSIKIGDNWISYNKLPPSISIPMLLASSYMQSQATGVGKSRIQSVLDSFGSFGKYVADQSYVKNIGELVAAMQGDTTKGNPVDTLITNDAQQLVPFRAFSGWLAKLMDPYQRQIDTSQGAINKQVQLFMQQIPGLRQQLSTRNDAQGNPIPNQNRLFNAASPFQMSQTTPQKEQSYQDFNTIKTMNAQESADSKALTLQAQTLYEQLKLLPKDQANAQADALQTSNPALYAKLKTAVTNANNKKSADEKQMMTLGVTDGVRAKFIYGKVMQLGTADEKNAYITDLQAKKVITPTVFEQIKQLISKPPPSSPTSMGLGSEILGALTGAGTAHASTGESPPPSIFGKTGVQISQPSPWQIQSKAQVTRIIGGIANNETGGVKTDPYSFSKGDGAGGTDLGKYQVNTATLKDLSKKYLGRQVTPQEFLSNPQLQDQFMIARTQNLLKQGYTPAQVADYHRNGSTTSPGSSVYKRPAYVSKFLNYIKQ